jgi:tetraacyldisaccharide 4'-kinase
MLLWGQRLIERGAPYLAPLGWVWGFVSFCKNALYDRRWLPIARVNRPVVSIGNLVAGGTGKTPLVHLIASRFPHRNIAILSRGYGGMSDEALLLARRLPEAVIYVGKDRVELARRAVKGGAQLILLDDGFQYRKLYRDFDLVILAGADPFGRGHFLPHGFLRDSPNRLKSADAIFVSGHGSYPSPCICVKAKVERILDLDETPVPSIHGWRIASFCGIARPASFKKTLEGLGADVIAEWILADHEQAVEGRLKEFARRSKALGAKAILCTEKDVVKIRPGFRCLLPIFFVEISLYVADGVALWENLIAKIDQKIDNITAYE